ncbi:hypothetical protein PXD04_01245 [Methanosphaera sp. ISO3-F5]|uniref:hypothetical protein n=1 Tax=Methanosphaera sp. ISO3-F5 TaxID=1452353 RepID=UPI002B25C449|nr:hypothetical protein [Methanosphaera sp. ISO3-F5]WQH64450.1 hypothetical protein PXD04_01245 [Methanosphaera sp. ISO3-F5]
MISLEKTPYESEDGELHVTSLGGAVYFNGTNNNLNIVDSNFTSNGYALFDVDFNYDYSDDTNDLMSGGALYIESNANTSIVNSIFYNNTAAEGMGITYRGHENSHLLINNTVFDLQHNPLMGVGGGLCVDENEGSIIIDNSNFTSNYVFESAAIYYFGQNKSSLEIINSNFEGNGYSEQYDTTVNWIMGINSYGYVLMANNTFKENLVSSSSVIELDGANISKFILDNNTFDSNYARDYNWGTYVLNVYVWGEAVVNNCTFKGDDGKKINALSSRNSNVNSTLLINNTKFYLVGSIRNDQSNSVLYINRDGNISVTNCDFISNEGDNIGIITSAEGNLLLENNTFDSNKAEYNGITIRRFSAILEYDPVNDEYKETYYNWTCKTKIMNNTFTNNTSSNGILNYVGVGNNTLEIVNSEFSSNDLSNRRGDGGALCILTMGNTSITNTTFDSNTADEGSAFYCYATNNSNLEITGSVFRNNGDDSSGSGGAIYMKTDGNVVINDSKFISNIAENGDAIDFSSETCGSLTINNSEFISNGKIGYDMEDGAVIISTVGNVSIDNSYFSKNYAESISTIDFDGNNTNHINITNSIFDSNGGDKYNPSSNTMSINNANFFMNNLTFHNNSAISGGAFTIYKANGIIKNSNFTDNFVNNGCIESSDSNCTIISSNFINNKLYESEYDHDGSGAAINNHQSNITINQTKFIGNGFDSSPNGENSCGAFYNYGGNLYIDNSQFISNIAAEDGGAIFSAGSYSQDDTEMVITNTLFENNTILSIDGSGGAISANNKKTVIDNCTFISNHANNSKYSYGGAISAPNYEYKNYEYFNVTNSVFINNTPSTFIITNGMIELDQKDNYVPNYANILIFVNAEEEGVRCELVEDSQTKKSYITGYHIDGDNYAYKLVVNQTEDAELYNINKFYNNVYIMQLPHDYTLSVNVTTPVKWANNTTINGKMYYTKNDGTEAVLSQEEVELYVNGNYITSNLTNENGEYQFNYTANIIGTQNVTVKFPGNSYLGSITNTTSFEVEQLETKLSIYANNTTYNEKTNITCILHDENNIPIPNANITLYVDLEQINKTTDENGTFTIEYEAKNVGDNYIIAFYYGDYSHKDTLNSTTFHVNKLNTYITVNAENTTIGNEITITGKLTDNENNAIAHATIILFIDEEEIKINTTTDGEFTYKYTAVHPDENYVEVFYEGNDTYSDSINSTTFHVERINTTIKAEITNKTVGNLSIKVNITGNDTKKITNGTVIIYDETGQIVTAHNIEDTTIITITNITSGTYTYNITYPGNKTYNPSSTMKTITIKPEAKITIEVQNNTEGNVIIEINVTDETGNPLTETEVNITLPNGTNTTLKTNTEGIITVTDTNSTPGEATIKAEITTNDEIEGTEAEKTFTIEPNYQKIIDEMNKTIQEQNQTIQELENIIDDLNKTSVITAIPDNGTVGNSKVAVTLNNKLGNPIANAPITVKNSKGETIGTATTDENGIAVIPVDTKAGTDNITVSYSGSKDYKPASTTVTTTTSKNNVTVTVDPVNGIIGEKITLTAHITDTNGNPVSGGNLVFKLNGKTLRTDGRFDSNATAQKFKVQNGVVTVTITADLYLRNIKNLTASYSGSYKYNEAKSSTVTAQIKKRDATITVTASPKSQKQYQTITFTAKLTDKTPNTKNTTAMSTNTKVLFKINGKTIKDKNGNNLLVKVTNNTATYKYTVPAGMGGVTKEGATRNYDVEAVLVSDTYYPDTRGTTTFNVQRSPVTISLSQVKVNKNNQISIQTSIKDYKGNNVVGTSTIAVKINGKTYTNPSTNKTQQFTATDGKVNLNNIQVSKDIKIKKVMIVTGDRQAYLGARNETSNIVKV